MATRRALRVALVLASSVILFLLLGSSAHAAFPGRNGRIAFVRTGPEVRSHVWTMADDGAAQRRLTSRRGEEPAWSPHGTRIAFSWLKTDGTDTVGSILLADADGASVRRLSRGLLSSNPAWSPTGREIAFHGLAGEEGPRPDASFRISIVSSASGDLLALGPSPPHRHGSEPAWSPSGRLIAFEVSPFHPNRDYSSEVFTMKPDGSHVTRITDNRSSEHDLDWSPDGSQLLYVRVRRHGAGRVESDIAVMGAHGHDVRVLTHTKRNEGSAAFSPNGRRIVFHRCCYGQSETSEIFTMRTDGTHLVRLTFNEVNDTAPDWQPIPRGH